MSVFLERLRAGEILLCDGAMGTALMSQGVQPGSEMDRAALGRPDLVADISRQYLAAGADIIQTHTFSASPARLEASGLETEMVVINTAAVHIAQSVTLPATLVAGDIGPSGCFNAAQLDGNTDLARESFHRQISVLAEQGVDLILAETLSSPEEARLIVETTRRISSTLPIVISFHVTKMSRGFRTLFKASLPKIVAALADFPPDVIGLNCGIGIDEYIEAVRELRQLTDIPLICQPNAGVPSSQAHQPFSPDSPAYMAERLPALLDAGAVVVGGCCQTTPAHTAAFRRVISMRSDPLSYN